MNEFDEFEGELDDGLLEQIDAIEAHHMHVPPTRMESVAELDDEFADPSLDALMMNEMDTIQGSDSPALQLRGASDPPSTFSLTTTPHFLTVALKPPSVISRPNSHHARR